MTLPGKIDVHHHYLPGPSEFDISSLLRLQNLKGAGPRLPQWTAETSKAYMEKVGATAAILSFPIMFAFDAKKGIAVAHQVNSYAAKIRDAEPSTFGFLAALPSLLEPDAAIAEIRHALDDLDADGVLLQTRYADKCPGHEAFEPVWAALNERSAVVLVHPGTTWAKASVNKYVDPSVAAFPQETTDAALDMIMNNTLRKFPNCKVILAHAGGTLPYLVRRAAALVPVFAANVVPPPKLAAEILEDAERFYFDLALAGSSHTLDTLLRNFPRDRVLFGSDYPFAPPPATIPLAKELDAYEMDAETREMVYRKNALALFPRLQKAQKLNVEAGKGLE